LHLENCTGRRKSQTRKTAAERIASQRRATVETTEAREILSGMGRIMGRAGDTGSHQRKKNTDNTAAPAHATGPLSPIEKEVIP
jgi:hypothetical protein